jgi:hypothetical protein
LLNRAKGNSLQIYKNKWFEKFARKAGINDTSLIEAVTRAKNGTFDADLGNGEIWWFSDDYFIQNRSTRSVRLWVCKK